MNTAVITVNYNGRRFLKDYAEAINNQTYKDFCLYFVDGGSNDNSADYIKKTIPNSKIFRLKENVGFAKGNNIAMRDALQNPQIKYIVLVNNDTIADKNWLKELIAGIDPSKNIDMACGMTLFTTGKVQTIGMRFDKNLVGDPIDGLSIGYRHEPKEFKDSREVFCPSGVSAIFTRRLLLDVGLFDEDFFMYVEDLDLGLRARNKGYRCVSNPKSKLVHLHSQTAGKASPMKMRLLKRNIYFTAIKNLKFIDLALFPIRDMTWNVKMLFNRSNNSMLHQFNQHQGPVRSIMIAIRAYTEIIIGTPRMLYKRFCMSMIAKH